MVPSDQDPIGGERPIEVDEKLVGGKTRGEGCGVHHNIYFVGAVKGQGESWANVGVEACTLAGFGY